MTVLRIYTDGGCAGNQSKTNFGGWGAVLEYGQTTERAAAAVHGIQRTILWR